MNGLYITLGIAVASGVFVAGLLYCVLFFYRKDHKRATYAEQVREIIGATQDDAENGSNNLYGRWCEFWSTTLKASSMERYSGRTAKQIGSEMAVISLACVFVLSFLLWNIAAGIVITSCVLAFIVMLSKNTSNRKSEKIFNQLSGFMYAFRANIEARKTPQEAFIRIVDDLPEPLRSELVPVKQSILANRPFGDSLKDLMENSSSRDLRFLAACILQASASGGDIVGQLDTIQSILESRQLIKDEIHRGYKTAAPLVWVGSLLIPVCFIISVIVGMRFEQQFWFVNPISWPAFLVLALLYGTGLIYTRKSVSSLRKM